MKPFDASQLREWITLERPVTTAVAGGAGEVTQAWITVRRVRAAVFTISHAEQLGTDNQIKDIGTHDMKVRYASDIRSDWRLRWKDQRFSIVGIVNTGERNVELVIRCGSVNA